MAGELDIWSSRRDWPVRRYAETAQLEYVKIVVSSAEALSLHLGQRFRGGVVTGIAPTITHVFAQPEPPSTYDIKLLVGPPEAVERMAEDSCPHCGRAYDTGKEG